MDLVQLGALGEFVGAIAVLGTLVYIAIQTTQAREAAQRSYVQQRVDQRIRGFWADRDSPAKYAEQTIEPALLSSPRNYAETFPDNTKQTWQKYLE